MALVDHHQVVLIDRRHVRRLGAQTLRFTRPWMVQIWTLVAVSGVMSSGSFRPKMSAKVCALTMRWS